ncbi:MAG: hypothetical protein F4X26_10610 [Chloroflexi bacterium]|nr:hypothetical protein [Chloroflexota bacterium]
MTTQADQLSDRVTRIESILEHMATKADLAQMEARMTRWTVAAMLAGMAAAAAIAAAVAAIAA